MTTTYRGQSSLPPVAPYAFTATPVLTSGGNPLRQHPTAPHLRLENRTFSAPAIALTSQTTNNPSNQTRQRQLAAVPVAVSASGNDVAITNQQTGSRDDNVIPIQRTTALAPRPLSAADLNLPEPKLSSATTPSKPSPDRYRRNHRRAETSQPALASTTSGSAMPSGSGMATVGHLYTAPTQTSQHSRMSQISTSQDNLPSQSPAPRLVSKDDMNLSRQASSDLAKRYRRRSISSLEAGEFAGQLIDPREIAPIPHTKSYASVVSAPYQPDRQDLRPVQPLQRPISSHARHASDESVKTNSRPSSVSSNCSQT